MLWKLFGMDKALDKSWKFLKISRNTRKYWKIARLVSEPPKIFKETSKWEKHIMKSLENSYKFPEIAKFVDITSTAANSMKFDEFLNNHHKFEEWLCIFGNSSRVWITKNFRIFFRIRTILTHSHEFIFLKIYRIQNSFLYPTVNIHKNFSQHVEIFEYTRILNWVHFLENSFN